MKHNRLKVICTCLLTVGVLALCGCQDTKTDKKIAETKVWSTYSTVKVLQNQKEDITYEALNAECNIQMMKNETEGAQLIISAAEDIASYNLVVSDLADKNGNLISKEDISVYHQKYLLVNSKTDLLNEEIMVGDRVPDMLLPLETAIEYGENVVAAGENQGITVEVKTHGETVPGTYTGTFVLQMDDKEQEIPVSVEVWDISYDGKRSFQSSFLIYYNALIAGEYEASDELVERYQEFFLDYKVNTFVIRDNSSTEKLVQEAVTFYDNHNYNSICIPRVMTQNYTYECEEADLIVDYIKEIVKASTVEKPYYKHLYIYPSYFDEIDMYPEKYDEFVQVFQKDGEWEKTLKRALQEVKAMSEYQQFDSTIKSQIDESIVTIPAVVPVTVYKEEWVDNLHVTFCPMISLLDEGSVAQRFQRRAETNNHDELWTYTCIEPTHPYPTFHIDDYNLGTRVSGWMEKKYHVDGYLYWAVNLYEPVNADTWRYVNPYETAERASNCAGDGYLCYPGAYYGSEYPFGSVRLVAFRDSMEDYDMLSVYEELLMEKALQYGIETDFDACVKDLYDTLLHGTKYYTDDAKVFAVREKLAERILALQGELSLIAVPQKNGLLLYANTDSIIVNDKDVSGTACTGGYMFTLDNNEQATGEVTISKEDVVAHYMLQYAKDIMVENVSKNTASKASLTDGVLEATICCEAKENAGASERFKPYVQFETEKLEGAKSLRFTLKQPKEEEIEGFVYLVMSNMTVKQIGSFFTNEETTNVQIDFNEEVITDEVLKDATGVKITFANTNTSGELLPDKHFSLEDFYVEMR